MKKTLKAILALFMAFITLATAGIAVFALTASDFADNSAVREYQDSIAKYTSQMKELEKDLKSVQSERYSLQQKVNNSQ